MAPCNTEVDQCQAPDPVDCELAAWSEWSDCTHSCGGGVKTRNREVATFPKRGGSPCFGKLKEVKGCNAEPCVKPKDCVWAEWEAWGACSVLCGGGEKTRFRRISAMPEHGGKPCDEKASVEVAACNLQNCGEKQYCAWAEWSAWGSCSADCGLGTQTRVRELGLTDVNPEEASEGSEKALASAVVLNAVLTGDLALVGSKLFGGSSASFGVEHLVCGFGAGFGAALLLLSFFLVLGRAAFGRGSSGAGAVYFAASEAAEELRSGSGGGRSYERLGGGAGTIG